MSHTKHRPGINTAYLLTRRVKLAGLTEDSGRKVIEAIARLKGVATVCITDEKEALCVSYDASKCSFDRIELILLECSGRIADDWWTRLKRSWYRFTDDNARANAEHVPHCCNKPPR